MSGSKLRPFLFPFLPAVLFVYYCEEDCLKASARGKDNAKAKHKHMPATPAGECGHADGIPGARCVS